MDCSFWDAYCTSRYLAAALDKVSFGEDNTAMKVGRQTLHVWQGEPVQSGLHVEAAVRNGQWVVFLRHHVEGGGPW